MSEEENKKLLELVAELVKEYDLDLFLQMAIKEALVNAFRIGRGLL